MFNVHLYSLRILLPTGFAATMLLLILVAMGSGVYQGYAEVKKTALADIKREVSQLSRAAERLLLADSELLEDEVTQIRLNPRVSSAAVTDHKNTILIATDFKWRDNRASDVIPDYDEVKFEKIKETKLADIHWDDENRKLVAIMSYMELSSKHTIRSNNRGLVYLAYDLSKTEDQVFKTVLLSRSIEFIFVLFVTFFVILMVRTHVTNPLSKLQLAVNRFAYGGFSEKLISKGPEEISELSSAFNQMSDQVDNYVNKIKSQNKHTKTILENVVDAIITIDQNGSITSFNAAAEEIFGYSQDAVMRQDVTMLMPDSYKSAHRKSLASYLNRANKEPLKKVSIVEGLRSNGEQFPMEIAINKIEIDGQKTFIGIIRDITERRKVELLKNEFISTVSHELRTPLTSLNGAVGLIASGKFGQLDGQVDMLIQTAKRNGDRLLSLINDILDMEKISAGKMKFHLQPHDLQKIINNSIQENEEYAKRYHTKFCKQGDSSTTIVNVDESRLEQVLSNMLSNACKFTKENSDVTITITKLEDSVRVSVTDHGNGIPEEFQSKIFQKFSQAESVDYRKTGGTGLGLAISKELIERMGGTIGFESTTGVGATFYFDIPIFETE